jgi:hypothetical protein
MTSKKVLDLLLEISKKGYIEGRKHEAEEEHMKSFEETEIYKEIKDNWKG